MCVTHHLKLENYVICFILFYFEDVISVVGATKKKEYIYDNMQI